MAGDDPEVQRAPQGIAWGRGVDERRSWEEGWRARCTD